MEEVCLRHDLQLVATHTPGFGGSGFVARVRSQSGADLVLKQTTPERGVSELTALRAWSTTGDVPRLVAELGAGLYLAEWIAGPTLADVPLAEPVDARTIGRVLRLLHAVLVPAGLPSIWPWFATDPRSDLPDLDIALQGAAGAVAARVRAAQKEADVLLHGDLVPTNIVMAVTGPRVIDPVGATGPPAYDLATLAAAAAGRGRPGMLPDLLAGYGTVPPLLAELHLWQALHFLQGNLAAGRAEFVRRLAPLVWQLVADVAPG